MVRLIAIVALLLLLPVAGCNKGDTSQSAATAQVQTPALVSSAEAASTQATPAASESDYEPLAGQELELLGDEKVLIVSVGELDAKSKDMEGLVAIEGKVAESYPDRGTIILVDVVDSGCGDDCATCPRARVPVRLSKADGEEKVSVPGVDEMVIVVADLSLTETGYTLNVRELRKVGHA